MALLALKGAIVLGAVAVAALLLRSSAASTRRLLLASGVVGALALPLLAAVVPTWGLWRPARLEAIESVAEVALASPVPLPAAMAERLPAIDALASAAGPAASTPRPAARASISWGAAATGLWLAIAVALLCRLGVGVVLTMRLGTGAGDGNDAWLEDLEAAAGQMGVAGADVRLRFGDAVAVPAVIGITRPVICLPREALEWSPARRRIVLLHELAHVKHRDNLLNLLGQVLCAIRWFDPLAWWVVRRCEVESERTVDDEVLAVGTRASDYAATLVTIARRGRAAALASTMARGAGLRARIAWLLDSRRDRRGWSAGRRCVFVGVGAVALALLAGASGAVEASRPGPWRGAEERAAAARDSSTEALAAALAERYDVAAGGIELTIDRPLQGIVDDEVRSLAERSRARSVSVVAIDPCNGHVLALGAWAADGRASAARALEPGPTLGPITVAAALEEGMPADARFFCGNGVWRIGTQVLRDASPASWLDARGIVARSSAIGTGRIYQAELGWSGLRSWLGRFGLDGRAAPQIPGAEAGRPLATTGSELDGVLAANGVGLQTGSVQLAAAYATLAAGGLYAAPTLARRVTDAEGRVVWEHRPEPRRVVSEPTARAVVDMLEAAVQSDEGPGRNARVDGVAVAGAPGTVRSDDADGDPSNDAYAATFVGIVRPGDSHLVLLVSVEGSIEGQERFTGGEVAAPAFARIVSRARAVSEHVE